MLAEAKDRDNLQPKWFFKYMQDGMVGSTLVVIDTSSSGQAPPVPDVDRDNVEFVIFMRAAKVALSYLCSSCLLATFNELSNQYPARSIAVEHITACIECT